MFKWSSREMLHKSTMMWSNSELPERPRSKVIIEKFCPRFIVVVHVLLIQKCHANRLSSVIQHERRIVVIRVINVTDISNTPRSLVAVFSEQGLRPAE
ncbi:hypothetical protein BC938DRAFT_477499 [Jimgerdemannia flammicorona]|uniref:Uncharacterized protein n=1 Tax=Jimgerdemannia flammicorona TaxID=994334 RepID=A0A433QP82_9FUNG|nr:hypothetical protein BC938DRAFT_477499 [Jimgerdemannia flammicorona]